MDIQDLINAADPSKASSWCVNFDDFAEELGFSVYGMSWKDEAWKLFEGRVTGVAIYEWLCTDSMVGIFGYFFDGKPICLSFQTGRKMDKNFYWVSQDAAKSVSDFIESLLEEEKRFSISLLSDFNERNWDWDEIRQEIANNKT